ncbi:MAG: NADH-quinone oxidoreductase subunit C [Fusobacteria bacterium]|nr:NADH-quinone oxidoreductase subunit C [Fusobacteriota bacterium]
MWKSIKNCELVNLKELEPLLITQLREEILDKLHSGGRLLALFCDRNIHFIYCIIALDKHSQLMMGCAFIHGAAEYESLTQHFPACEMFERELFETTHIRPLNHPNLKPLRNHSNPFLFHQVHSKEVHEVGVGPVHAGIIEPGYFRFNALGEKILHLEIQLGYQHKGIEKLFEDFSKQGRGLHLEPLAEAIVGDSAIAHTLAYVHAIESLCKLKVPKRAQHIRTLALELERIGNHLGNIGDILGDIGYYLGKDAFIALKTEVINAMLKICGSRFGISLISVGGVNYSLADDFVQELAELLTRVKHNAKVYFKIHVTENSSVLSRLEGTGIVTLQDAMNHGFVGLTARSCGMDLDVRSDYPCGVFQEYPIKNTLFENGDVFDRTVIRFVEILHSIEWIIQDLERYTTSESREIFLHNSSSTHYLANHCVVSLVEGWRGEIMHCVLTDDNGHFERYKIKDASFNNWNALPLAVYGEGISDFPLCNKSFNLSYSGHDL